MIHYLRDPFEVDLTKKVVTLGFECIIPGKEGRGVDYVTFDDDGKIVDVTAVRS